MGNYGGSTPELLELADKRDDSQLLWRLMAAATLHFTNTREADAIRQFDLAEAVLQKNDQTSVFAQGGEGALAMMTNDRAFSYDGEGTVRIFMDDQMIAKKHVADYKAVAPSPYPLTLGDRSTSNYSSFVGKMAQFRYYQGIPQEFGPHPSISFNQGRTVFYHKEKKPEGLKTMEGVDMAIWNAENHIKEKEEDISYAFTQCKDFYSFKRVVREGISAAISSLFWKNEKKDKPN